MGEVTCFKTRTIICNYILLFIVLLGFITIIHGEEESDETSAQALNTLGLVQGSGGSYHIADSLTRAEAITLILRLTSTPEIDDEVLTFSDVNEDDWFYTAVTNGASLGIVNGYPDGSFRPNDTISRQAFLKMLLEVLGYRYNTDYSWGTVNTFGVTTGLINHEEASQVFLRKDAFDIMTRLLGANYNMSGETYFNRMSTLGIISKEQQEAFLSRYSIESFRLVSVKSPSDGKVILKMNQSLSGHADAMTIVLKDNQDVIITDTTFTTTGKLIIIDNPSLEEGMTYTIVVSGIMDDFRVITKDLSKVFEYNVDLASFNLYVKNIEIQSSRHILVEFNTKMYDNAFSTSSYSMRINGERKFVGIEKLSDSKAIVVLREDLAKDDIVKLMIMGSVTDIYGHELFDGYNYAVEVEVESDLISELRVESIESIGNGVVRLTFNMPVETRDGVENDNYQINDLSEGGPYVTSTGVVDVGTDELLSRQYDISYFRFIDGNLYYLKTTNVDSLGGAYTLESQQYRFTYVDGQISFSIQKVEAIDGNHMVATFSQPVDEQSLASASLEIGGYAAYARTLDEEDASKVHVYMLNALDENKSYYLKVENLKSEYDMEIGAVSKSFTSNDVSRSDIQSEVSILDNGDYLIQFNREIKAFSDGGLISIGLLTDESPISTQVQQSDYRIIDRTSIVISGVAISSEVTSVEFGSVYLYGDGYYIGNVSVPIE